MDVEQLAFKGIQLGNEELYGTRVSRVPEPIRYMRFHLEGTGKNRVVISVHLSPCPATKYVTKAGTLASCGSGRGRYPKQHTEVVINLTQREDSSIECLRASRFTTGDTRMHTAVTSSKALQRLPTYLSIGVNLDANKKTIRVNAGRAIVVLRNVAELTPFTHWRRVNIQSEQERVCKVTHVNHPNLKKAKRKRREPVARSPLATLSVDSPGKPPSVKRVRRLNLTNGRAAGRCLFE